MKYINDFKEDDRVIDHYLCKQKQSLKSRTGKTYLTLRLQDKTGMIDAKVWDLNNDIQAFDEGDFIKIDGIVLSYQNELQLKVSKIRRSLEGEFDPADHIPCTDKDVDEMYSEIEKYIKSIENPYLRSLMENILLKNTEIADQFKKHSAAKNLHHSYMGGLIEHTLNVTQICDYLSTRYVVNRDILITTALLHDLGKLYELSSFPSNEYTDDGQLLGHIVICAELISREADKIHGFPHKLLTLIQHCVLSHHGEYEFGSPKLPQTMEAFVLHNADNLDAKLKMFQEFLDSDNTMGEWAGYSKIFGRYIRKTEF
jgi:3'-5' exoribonuclease